ncbi:MAG: ABC transporter ATP-binding protein [Oscillospiraceae bacterium]
MSESMFLSVRDLKVDYVMKAETIHAVNGISFDLEKGKTLGLVGETGAGKTTIARSILGILQVPPGVVRSGEILLEGGDLLKMTAEQLCHVRGNRVTMIFQDPMTALNPVMTVGSQIAEVIQQHNNVGNPEARRQAEEMLEMVGIPAERYGEYPHQFSGGMKQRVVIAIALACNPDLLLADEPTTALDVTIQAQMLDLIKRLHEVKGTSTVMITHDLGVVAETCDNVAVIYAGEIVEIGTLEQIFDNAKHPYTIGLFGAVPVINRHVKRLSPIHGLPPDPTNLPEGCKFNPRCPRATERCRKGDIPNAEVEPGHLCRCLYIEEENHA